MSLHCYSGIDCLMRVVSLNLHCKFLGYLFVIHTTLLVSGDSDQAIVLQSDSTNLVDPASSHMLVSKIKPCKSKYKLIYTAKLRIAHYNSYNLHDDHYQMDIHGNSGANTC
jgi:hypothetical protein